jgi:uncharacterized protein Yka (UPF0111/DUF47 family)
MAFKTTMELEELYDLQRDLQERKDNFFDGGEVFEGDRGYQDIWERLNEVSEQINDIETEFDENPDVIDQSIFEIEDINASNPYYDNAGDYEID